MISLEKVVDWMLCGVMVAMFFLNFTITHCSKTKKHKTVYEMHVPKKAANPCGNVIAGEFS